LLAVVAAGVFVGFGLLFSLLGSEQGSSGDEAGPGEPVIDAVVPPVSLPATTEPSEPTPVERYVSIDGIPDSENPSTTPITDWLPGDDGAGPLPLGEVDRLSGNLYLYFLVEYCAGDRCFRDAVMRDLDNSEVDTFFLGDTAFLVRHGFPNSGDEPLGEGYGVDVYITRRNGPKQGDGVFELGQTYKYTSDYVIHGTAKECGPLYEEQSSPVECEWFVHDFLDGIPTGRYDLWAVWLAPCSYWLDIGLTASCARGEEVMSFFSASVNSPFGYD
jgi:hypothetical protein